MMGRQWNTGDYLASLKTELGIAEAQESAWKAYADTVAGAREQLQGMHATMFEAMDTASWQERRNMMNRMLEARREVFDSVHAAAEQLLPTLNPAQQVKARESLPGLAYRPRAMHRRWPASAPR